MSRARRFSASTAIPGTCRWVSTGFRSRGVKCTSTSQGIYLNHSPVGGISYPYIVGGNGWLYNTDVIVTF